MKKGKKIGELLKEAGLIDDFQLNASLAYQKSWGGRLGSILLRKGFLTEKDMASVMSKQFEMPCMSLDRVKTPPPEVLNTIKADVARKFGIFPIGMEGKTLLVAVADPSDLKTLDDLSFTIGIRVKPVLALESEITRAIETNYEGKYNPGAFIIDGGSIQRERGNQSGSPEVYERTDRQPETDTHLKKTPPASHGKPEISQRIVMESLIDLLAAKGVFTKEELMTRIRSRIQNAPTGR